MLAVLLSIICGFFAVAMPQMVLAYMTRLSSAKKSLFSFWAAKFSITVLLLASALRLLHELSLLHAAYFLIGVLAALIFNIAALLLSPRLRIETV